MNGAIAQEGSGATQFMYYCVGQNEATYAVAFRLVTDQTQWWCVDSSNVPKQEPASNMTGTALGTASGPAACP